MPQTDSKSSLGQEQQQTAQTVPYPSPHLQQFEDDTIDLYELLITLWNRRWLVIAVTVVAALGSIVYALQLQHIYKAEALLLPPKSKDIQLLYAHGLKNFIKTDQDSIAPAVFSKFKINLFSRNLQKKFIQEKGLMELLAPERNPETRDEEIYNGFANLIVIEEKNLTTSLSIELHDAEIAAQWVNDLIEFIDKETIAMLVADSQNSIANQIKDIEYRIASKRHIAKRRRDDTILRYEEAAIIASKLGVMDRVDSTNIVQNNQLNITTSNIPLYFRGFKALSAEIAFLKNRQSDDPFISGLRDLQEKLSLLRSINFSKQKMHAVQIDQAAYPPNRPFKPNRRLIVSVTTFVGLLSGIFLAFFIEYVKNQRKKHSE